MAKSCLKCIHFKLGANNPPSAGPTGDMFTDVGLCRRHPPRWIPDVHSEDEGGLYAFPAIHQGHRCGEWSDGSEWNSPC